MRKVFSSMIFLMLISTSVFSYEIKIHNTQAKNIYNHLTKVQDNGAAGHIFREGKSILCWRVNADMTDAAGKDIPPQDARRYTCSMRINPVGFATPGRP